jgi:hypothetical protein
MKAMSFMDLDSADGGRDEVAQCFENGGETLLTRRGGASRPPGIIDAPPVR